MSVGFLSVRVAGRALLNFSSLLGSRRAPGVPVMSREGVRPLSLAPGVPSSQICSQLAWRDPELLPATASPHSLLLEQNKCPGADLVVVTLFTSGIPAQERRGQSLCGVFQDREALMGKWHRPPWGAFASCLLPLQSQAQTSRAGRGPVPILAADGGDRRLISGLAGGRGGWQVLRTPRLALCRAAGTHWGPKPEGWRRGSSRQALLYFPCCKRCRTPRCPAAGTDSAPAPGSRGALQV